VFALNNSGIIKQTSPILTLGSTSESSLPQKILSGPILFYLDKLFDIKNPVQVSMPGIGTGFTATAGDTRHATCFNKLLPIKT
jgi:hypothetical protein